MDYFGAPQLIILNFRRRKSTKRQQKIKTLYWKTFPSSNIVQIHCDSNLTTRFKVFESCLIFDSKFINNLYFWAKFIFWSHPLQFKALGQLKPFNWFPLLLKPAAPSMCHEYCCYLNWCFREAKQDWKMPCCPSNEAFTPMEKATF